MKIVNEEELKALAEALQKNPRVRVFALAKAYHEASEAMDAKGDYRKDAPEVQAYESAKAALHAGLGRVNYDTLVEYAGQFYGRDHDGRFVWFRTIIKGD